MPADADIVVKTSPVILNSVRIVGKEYKLGVSVQVSENTRQRTENRIFSLCLNARNADT